MTIVLFIALAVLCAFVVLLLLEMRRTNVTNRAWFDRIQALECMFADHRAMVDEIKRAEKARRNEQLSVLTSQQVRKAPTTSQEKP